MMIFAYIAAYFVIGAVFVKIADKFEIDLDFELTAVLFMLWPMFAIMGMFALILKVFIPDIFERDVGGAFHSVPPPPPHSEDDLWTR